MMKQARTLLSRSLCHQSKSLLEGNFRASMLRGFASWEGSSTTGQSFSGNKDDARPGGRVLAPYAIFKGKAALSVSPCLPTFTETDSGNIRVDRRGTVMMTFMPAVGERKYDWERKQKFALSPTEVGEVISMGPQDTAEFFHDPAMKTSNAGQVRKTMSIKPHANGSGYFISLSVNNNLLNTNEWLVVPVTTAEFTVLKTAFSFALPHLLGWDQVISQASPAVQIINSQPKINLQQPKTGLQLPKDDLQQLLEWDK